LLFIVNIAVNACFYLGFCCFLIAQTIKNI